MSHSEAYTLNKILSHVNEKEPGSEGGAVWGRSLAWNLCPGFNFSHHKKEKKKN